MPALEEHVVQDVEGRLSRHLAGLVGYSTPEYITSGGSAAIFRVTGPEGERAIKVFNPSFFADGSSTADRRRLAIQRSTIGHDCPTLVQTFSVVEAEGTAFVEMEYIDWPSLKDCLASVPDNAIIPLLSQLVSAVKFLEAQNIVHRDIKPENIHISPDFGALKLLDLGVVRLIDTDDATGAAVTDHGVMRPFLATAQYSSPEYLFRLDEPSPKLWRGLNFYQLGGVLHDLLNKRPLFDEEMRVNNRWLVAKAVLTKTPTFYDETPNRLLHLKALAARCLAKDLDSRLAMVGWDDFMLEGASDPLTALAGRLAKRSLSAGEYAKQSAAARLTFDRLELVNRLVAAIRNELLPICGTGLPITLNHSDAGDPPRVVFSFSSPPSYHVECLLELEWLTELHERTANIFLQGRLLHLGICPEFVEANRKLAHAVTIHEGEADAAMTLASSIATIVGAALDLIEINAEKPLVGGQLLT